MQIEISDKTYRAIEAILAGREEEVPRFIDAALGRLAARLRQAPPPLPEKLQKAIESIGQRGASGPVGQTERLRADVASVRESFSEVSPDELQRWIDRAVDQVETEYRQQSDAHPAR